MLKKLFLLIFLTMAVLQAAPQISWADMDVSFKAGWTNSGPQNYGTSSSVVLTLTSTGTSDVIVRRVTMNGGQDISAKCTNVTIPCRMPPKSSLLFTLPEGTRISEITIVTDGGPLTMRYKYLLHSGKPRTVSGGAYRFLFLLPANAQQVDCQDPAAARNAGEKLLHLCRKGADQTVPSQTGEHGASSHAGEKCSGLSGFGWRENTFPLLPIIDPAFCSHDNGRVCRARMKTEACTSPPRKTQYTSRLGKDG